jgi:NAD(P)-dependent dehydrogenase (short-subunit alcohol dehydrogenase family)
LESGKYRSLGWLSLEGRLLMKLAGKVALVTGAGQGIGQGIALAFAKEGADIGVNALHVETSEATAEAVRKLGRKAVVVPADVAQSDEVDRMVSAVLEKLGKIDILVNNAGGALRLFTVLEYPPEEWDRVIAINLRSTYLCSRRVGQWMAKQKAGKILNISSVTGIGGGSFRGAYAPAKAGIINMTMVMAVELGKYNINVNCLAPGLVLVPRIKRLAEEEGFNFEVIINNTPLGRAIEPDDVAKAAIFLVSDAASAITGVTLPVDGGWLAYRALV